MSGVLWNNPCCWVFPVASKFKIGLGLHSCVAKESACPLLLFVWVGFCGQLLPLPLSCWFGLGFVVVGGPSWGVFVVDMPLHEASWPTSRRHTRLSERAKSRLQVLQVWLRSNSCDTQKEIMKLRKGLQNEESNRWVLRKIMCDCAKM